MRRVSMYGITVPVTNTGLVLTPGSGSGTPPPGRIIPPVVRPGQSSDDTSTCSSNGTCSNTVEDTVVLPSFDPFGNTLPEESDLQVDDACGCGCDDCQPVGFIMKYFPLFVIGGVIAYFIFKSFKK